MLGNAIVSLLTGSLTGLLGQMRPLAIVLLYLSLTLAHSPREREIMLRKACGMAGALLGFFALTGEFFFQILRIGPFTLHFAGGIILFALGFRILNEGEAERSTGDGDPGGTGVPKRDLSLLPLALPMIANPNAVLFLMRQHSSARGNFFLHLFHTLSALIAVGVIYCLLTLGHRALRWIPPILLKLGYRLSGLFLLAMALQSFMTGLRESELFSSFARGEMTVPSPVRP